MSLVFRRAVRLSTGFSTPRCTLPTVLSTHRFLHSSGSLSQKRSWADRIMEEIQETGNEQQRSNPKSSFVAFQDQSFGELDSTSPRRQPTEGNKSRWSSSLRVFNFPPTTTEDDLREVFQEHGEVSYISLRDVTKGRSATVTFRDPATADKVMHAHQEECLAVDGCQLTLRFGASTHLKKESNTLFVGNIDPEGDEARIRAMFETFGTIRAVRFGRERKVCFVEFKSVKDARSVVEAHEHIALRDGLRLLRINYEVPQELYEVPHHTICVSSYTGDPEQLEHCFETHDGGNHIVAITIANGDPMRPPLYFVKFDDVAYAKKAIDYIRKSGSGFYVSFARPTLRDSRGQRDSMNDRPRRRDSMDDRPRRRDATYDRRQPRAPRRQSDEEW